ncbi:hypothetical protein GQ55_1G443800 [Panicum hallii var. hallii]|uniref:Uncharacterized protein n=2 Tax=Panicum hallii TaxID=206008 RepID=A0A2T7FE21_9POAL|nr:hypothetical protein GQ55_1G443800 [Panicum hallii var. hallii]PVH67212.1 hypothetical protein PAHAL_1G453600 [Panicum hallii]
MKQRLPSQRHRCPPLSTPYCVASPVGSRVVGLCLAKASVWSPLPICWLVPPDSP